MTIVISLLVNLFIFGALPALFRYFTYFNFTYITMCNVAVIILKDELTLSIEYVQ